MGSITSLKTNKTLFIPCDCFSEIFVVDYDHELKVADIAIYEHPASYSQKMSLWQRLKYCWQVLWYKKPYADQIVLSHKQLFDLQTFLSSLDLGV